MKRSTMALIIIFVLATGALAASISIRNLPTASGVYDTDKVPVGRASNPDAIGATVRQIRQPFYNYTTRLHTLPAYLQISSAAGKSRLMPDGIYRNVSGSFRKVVTF